MFAHRISASDWLALPMLTCLFWFGSFAGEARATAYTWLGLGASDAWEDTLGNWNSPGFPGLNGSNDTVLFPSFNTQRYNVQINDPITIASMDFERPGYSMLVDGNFIVQNGITATTANAANWSINKYLTFGGEATVNNLTGSGLLFQYTAPGIPPAVLHVVGGASNFSGSIQDGIALTVGDGTQTASLTLNRSAAAANIYTGTTTVNANATLIAGTADALGASSAHVINGALSLLGSSTVGGLSGTGQVTLGTSTLTVDGGGTFSGAISGLGGLIKSGAGELSLSGTNGFTGSTTVSGGELAVNGSIAGGVMVQTGATLGGAGTIGGAVTVGSGGTLSPGNSPGQLTLQSGLTMNSNSTLSMEFAGKSAGLYDQLDVQGLFTAGGTLNLSLINGFTPSIGDSFTIFNGTTPGFDTGSFTIDTNLGGGLHWDTSALATSGIVTVVPEPSTLALLCLGVGGVFARRRVLKNILRSSGSINWNAGAWLDASRKTELQRPSRRYPATVLRTMPARPIIEAETAVSCHLLMCA